MVFPSQLDYIYDYCCSIQQNSPFKTVAKADCRYLGGTYKSTLYLILASRVIFMVFHTCMASFPSKIFMKKVSPFHILKVNGAQCYFDTFKF